MYGTCRVLDEINGRPTSSQSEGLEGGRYWSGARYWGNYGEIAPARRWRLRASRRRPPCQSAVRNIGRRGHVPHGEFNISPKIGGRWARHGTNSTSPPKLRARGRISASHAASTHLVVFAASYSSLPMRRARNQACFRNAAVSATSVPHSIIRTPS